MIRYTATTVRDGLLLLTSVCLKAMQNSYSNNRLITIHLYIRGCGCRSMSELPAPQYLDTFVTQLQFLLRNRLYT